MKYTQYSKELLEMWDSTKVGRLYMERYILSRECPEEDSQLELLAETLAKRPMLELQIIFRDMSRQLDASVKKEDYKIAALLRDMKAEFKTKLLDSSLLNGK